MGLSIWEALGSIPQDWKKKMQPLFGNRFFADVIKVKMEMKSW
jgi:hypothetical protein